MTTFGVAPAAAQTGQMFGELVGKVTDDQGGALPGVTVTLSGPAVMGTPSVVTGTTGQYRFPAVNSGTYSVRAVGLRAAGTRRHRRPGSDDDYDRCGDEARDGRKR